MIIVMEFLPSRRFVCVFGIYKSIVPVIHLHTLKYRFPAFKYSNCCFREVLFIAPVVIIMPMVAGLYDIFSVWTQVVKLLSK